MKFVLSLVALVLLAGTMFAATPNAIIAPEVPVVTVPLGPYSTSMPYTIAGLPSILLHRRKPRFLPICKR